MSTFLLLIGFAVTLAGLWFSASGLRIVVSGRIDERSRSASSLRFGVPLLVVGLLLLFSAVWLANWSP